MRGLNPEEERILRENRYCRNLEAEVDDSEIPAYEALTDRGLLDTWEEYEWDPEEEDWDVAIYWVTSPIGSLLLQVLDTMRVAS
jgi:hypothetical protein